MANIDFNDYKKKQKEHESEGVIKKTLRIGTVESKVTQRLVDGDDVLFDFLEVEFEGGPGYEVWMSFFGGDFKMKIDTMTKEEYDDLDIGSYIGYHLLETLGCLECKEKFLKGLCNHEHGDKDDDEITFLPDNE